MPYTVASAEHVPTTSCCRSTCYKPILHLGKGEAVSAKGDPRGVGKVPKAIRTRPLLAPGLGSQEMQSSEVEEGGCERAHDERWSRERGSDREGVGIKLLCPPPPMPGSLVRPHTLGRVVWSQTGVNTYNLRQEACHTQTCLCTRRYTSSWAQPVLSPTSVCLSVSHMRTHHRPLQPALPSTQTQGPPWPWICLLTCSQKTHRHHAIVSLHTYK